MSNFAVKDATLSTKYVEASGAGSDADPFRYTRAAKDAGPNWTPSYKTVSSADVSSAVDATDAPTSGQKVYIDDLVVSVGSALTLTFTEETTGTVIFKGFFEANSGFESLTLRNGRKLITADKKLRVQASGAGNVFVHCSWHSES